MSKQTKITILDTAEELFAKKGIAATSLRNIIAKAQVNIAAIHYHFGGKKELIKEVFVRRIGPINNKRLEMLDTLENSAAGNALQVKDIVHAYLMPVITIPFSEEMNFESIQSLISLVHREPNEIDHVTDVFMEMSQRFIIAFIKALPEVPPSEIRWRFTFMIGVMSTILFKDHPARKNLDLAMDETSQDELAKRVIQFISAGFCAPVSN